MYNSNISHEDLMSQHFPEALSIKPLTESELDHFVSMLRFVKKRGDLSPGKTETLDNGDKVRVERRISYFANADGHRAILLHNPWPDYMSVLGGCRLPQADRTLDKIPVDLPNCVFLRSLTPTEISSRMQDWQHETVSETGGVPDANTVVLYLPNGFMCLLEIEGDLNSPARDWKVSKGELWFDPFAEIDEDSFWNCSVPLIKRATLNTVNPIDKFNERYAFVTVGSKGRILEEHTNAAGDPDFRLLEPGTFLAQHSASQNQKGKSYAKLWLESKKRRTYEDIVFQPGSKNLRFYNMWRGFSVTPLPGYNHLRFMDHIRENVSQGDESLYNWIVGWFAHIMQRPAEKIGTSLALRGVQGCGKTLVGQHIGKLIKPYYRIVADTRHVTGNFNAHLAGTLLLQAEEAFWAGDKAAEGMLKHMVTSPDFLLERKGIDAVTVKNFTRLLITTNHNWVVPAALEERRFAVVDVNDQHAQDADYFGAIVQDLEDGGYANLLHYLLSFDLESVNLRQVPQTEGLLDQKIESLEPHDKWWLECLQDGHIDEYEDWPVEVRTEVLHSRYRQYCALHGVRRPMDGRQLGQALKKRVPQLKKIRKRDGEDRYHVYALPGLQTCRDMFSEAIRSHRPLFMADS